MNLQSNAAQQFLRDQGWNAQQVAAYVGGAMQVASARFDEWVLNQDVVVPDGAHGWNRIFRRTAPGVVTVRISWMA